MHSQQFDVHKDSMDPLPQVAILGNYPFLLQFLYFSIKLESFFITHTTSICHISRQVSLVSFTTGMSVVRMTVHISSVNDLEVPLTNLYDCPDPHENHIGSQGNTHTHTHCYLRVMIHRLPIVVLCERWGAGVETQKNVRGEIGGWGRVPFNETYAPSLSTIYDGA